MLYRSIQQDAVLSCTSTGQAQVIAQPVHLAVQVSLYSLSSEMIIAKIHRRLGWRLECNDVAADRMHRPAAHQVYQVSKESPDATSWTAEMTLH